MITRLVYPQVWHAGNYAGFHPVTGGQGRAIAMDQLETQTEPEYRAQRYY